MRMSFPRSLRHSLIFLALSLDLPQGASLAQQAIHRTSQQNPVPRSDDKPWWKHAVIYEIYPRSFQVSNGDGVGDLDGITSRLDYLRHLGIYAISVKPIYSAPLVA